MKELFSQHQFHEDTLSAVPCVHQRFYETAAVWQETTDECDSLDKMAAESYSAYLEPFIKAGLYQSADRQSQTNQTPKN